LLSKETFAELRRVLAYPKFHLTPGEISAIIEIEILPWIEVVEVLDKIAGICRDPHDDKFLAVAVHGGADLLITGDNDLLVLNSAALQS
jgi:putative PIN family toxin of toxin-antitoxin system